MTPVVLATSNGSGMGHLSRQVAVGLALARRRDPVEALLFSMSGALPLVAGLGLRAEYCPSYQRGWMPRRSWHDYLRDRLLALLEETGARLVVFDGVAPYRGLLLARAARPDVAFVGFRRGLWKPASNARALRAAPFFDLVVEPGDLAAAADTGPTSRRQDAVRVGPVTLVDGAAVLPRREAAAALGLDPDRPSVLVTLPADLSGGPHDGGAAGVAIDALRARADWQVAVTRTPLAADGTPLGQWAGVTQLRGVYPLVSYLSAFDAAVGAAGYNAVHELLLAGLPTLLLPSPGVRTDDQEARARWAQAAGLALAALPGDAEGIAAAVDQLMDRAARESLTRACRDLERPIGAQQAADVIADLVGRFERHRIGAAERVVRREIAGASGLARLLGPTAVAGLRRALGREVRADPHEPLAVRLIEGDSTSGEGEARGAGEGRDAGESGWAAPGGEPGEGTAAAPEAACLLTERLDPAVVRAGRPFLEHLLPGTSADYRARRRRIAEHYYRVASAHPARATAAQGG